MFKENSFSEKIISKKEIYKNHDWIIKTKIEKLPEINFEIHVGIYHFYYDRDYRNQK
ncbi:hypothetical protein ['Camptotheca acuminata' phytoplasma]|uniref:hypothetical protein n=1 Tax='Camptotheca acuminata' phytoplasma TaxID=3239192 RepID=UPI00351A7B95